MAVVRSQTKSRQEHYVRGLSKSLEQNNSSGTLITSISLTLLMSAGRSGLDDTMGLITGSDLLMIAEERGRRPSVSTVSI